MWNFIRAWAWFWIIADVVTTFLILIVAFVVCFREEKK